MEGQQMTDQTTLRDWFAIHAPAEPWPEFEPDIPPRPDMPLNEPVGNDGEAPSEPVKRILDYWRMRSPASMRHWYTVLENPSLTGDPMKDFPEYSYWMTSWEEYRRDIREWQQEHEHQRLAQWPYYYADIQMRERKRSAGK